MRGDFIIEIDRSNGFFGGMLSQDHGNGLYPIAYCIKKLTGAHHNCATHKHKELAIIVVLKKLYAYIDGKCTCTIHEHTP